MARKEFSFSESLKEIEEILGRIESGNMDIDKLSTEVKKASELIQQCQKKLRNTEEEIDKILKEMV